jgi:hypothetical protein
VYNAGAGVQVGADFKWKSGRRPQVLLNEFGAFCETPVVYSYFLICLVACARLVLRVAGLHGAMELRTRHETNLKAKPGTATI